MKTGQILKKWISMALCLCMLLQNAPVMAFAATTDNLCEHHTEHTAECGYAEAVAGSDCTHSHDGSCGYAQPVAEVLCACEATDENGALVHTEGCGYVAPVTGADCTHSHDEHCGYAAPVEAKPCTYHCDICLGHDHDEEEQEATAPSSEATEPSSEATEPSEERDVIANQSADWCGNPLCSQEDAFHVTSCAQYMAPENPQCFCVEKCTEPNVWCDVCGFDVTGCTGEAKPAVGGKMAISGYSGGTVYVHLTLKAVDVSGNEVTTAFYSSIDQDVIDNREGYGADFYVGDTYCLSGFDIDGYMVKDEEITFTVYSSGNISINSGNASVEYGSDTTYIVIPVNCIGGDRVTIDCSTIDLNVYPYQAWGPGWYADGSVDLHELILTEPYIFILENSESMTKDNVEYIRILGGAILNAGTLTDGVLVYAENGKIQSGTFAGQVNITADGEICGGTFNNVINRGIVSAGTFNGELTNYGTITNQGNIQLGEDFVLVQNGTVDCNAHIWRDGICRLCSVTCQHSWENGTCTVCKLVCPHETYENGVCTSCGHREVVTVEFDYNGGKFVAGWEQMPTASYSTYWGETVTLGQDLIAHFNTNAYREGYVLTGWNTEPDGTGTDYGLTGTITMEAMTLYAQWETCTHGEHTTDGCVCGLKDDSIHSFTKYVDNGDGTHDKVCTCGKVEVDNEAHTPAENATYTNNGNGTHSFTCTVCGDATEAHSFDENGTCVCGVNLFSVSGNTLTIDGTLGGKTEATEEDITVLVNKIQDCVKNGITTIIVTGSEPALIEMDSWTNTAIDEAIYRLSGSDDYDENNPYNGKIDLILQDVTEIVDQEFYSAWALNSITLPQVIKMGDEAFHRTWFLKTITFESVLTEVNETGGVMFAQVGKEVGGCDLILNCGQMDESSVPAPDLTNNIWKFKFENEFKSITLTHSTTAEDDKAATCISKAYCSVCKSEYGEVDADAHSYGDWVSNGDGTHKRTCANDSTHIENGDCSGGTATCTTLAVCDICGASYGEVDKNNHDETVAYVNGFCPNCDAFEPATDSDSNGYYDIDNAGKLYWFAAQVNSGYTNINGELKANIVVNENVLTADGEPNGDGSEFRIWTPIGTEDNAYTGDFCGLEHTISGLYFNDSNAGYVGLFGYVGSGMVNHLGVIDSYFNGSGVVGGVVGHNEGTVEYAYGNSYVGGNICIGGVVGDNRGTVMYAYNLGSISGLSEVGGVVGANYNTVKNCYNIVSISGDFLFGDVVGDNFGTLENCYYPADAETDELDGTTAKTWAQFKSGEVAYLLGRPFGQNIGTNSLPVLYGETVYYGYTSCGDTVAKYTNDETISAEKPDHTQKPTYTDNGDGTHSASYPCCGTTVTEDHTFDETGKCGFCGTIAQLEIKTQPENFVGAMDSYASFHVTANLPGVTYQWFYSIDAGESWHRSTSTGCTTDTLTVQIKAHRLNQLYRCVITDNQGNTVTSESVTMYLPENTIAIVTQPADVQGASGEQLTISVDAVGSGLTYRWYYSSNGQSWAQSTAEGFDTPAIRPVLKAYNSGRLFRCLITDANGNTQWSEAASMTLESAEIIITAQPEGYEGMLNDLAEFTVVAEGLNMNYQWYYSTDGGDTWQASYSTGYNTHTLQVRLYAYRSGYQYKCLLTSGEITVETVPVPLSLRPAAVTITTQPMDTSGALDSSVTFRTVAQGSGLTYQWQYSADGGSTWKTSGQTGANTDTLTVPVKAYRIGYLYRCSITDENGLTVYTDAAILQSGELAVITAQPEDFTGTVGQTAVFTVEAEGENLQYQWQYSNNGGSTWTNSGMSGNKTASLSVGLAAYRSGQQYRCVITNEYGSVISDAAVLTVN